MKPGDGITVILILVYLWFHFSLNWWVLTFACILGLIVNMIHDVLQVRVEELEKERDRRRAVARLIGGSDGS